MATLSAAIKQIPHLTGKLKQGLQALRKNHRDAILPKKSRKLSGSIDIDKALKSEHPHDHRWDYCIGVRKRQNTDSLVWVEFHPANSHSVSDMLAKATWLKQWLAGPGKPLQGLMKTKTDLRWVPTGPVAIRQASKQSKILAQAGISFPKRRIKL